MSQIFQQRSHLPQKLAQCNFRKFANGEQQNSVPLEKSLESKPSQPQLKMQEYELMIKNGKISCCSDCLNKFHRKNQKLCTTGRNGYDWYNNVKKPGNNKM